MIVKLSRCCGSIAFPTSVKNDGDLFDAQASRLGCQYVPLPKCGWRINPPCLREEEYDDGQIHALECDIDDVAVIGWLANRIEMRQRMTVLFPSY